MYGKQEIFEAFCKYCTGPAEEEPMVGWAAEMKMQILKENFEFYYAFFKEYIDHSPGSS